jgi:hypothetical protein
LMHRLKLENMASICGERAKSIPLGASTFVWPGPLKSLCKFYIIIHFGLQRPQPIGVPKTNTNQKGWQLHLNPNFSSHKASYTRQQLFLLPSS